MPAKGLGNGHAFRPLKKVKKEVLSILEEEIRHYRENEELVHSPCWLFFARLDAGVAFCLLCQKKYFTKNTLQGMKDHLSKEHIKGSNYDAWGICQELAQLNEDRKERRRKNKIDFRDQSSMRKKPKLEADRFNDSIMDFIPVMVEDASGPEETPEALTLEVDEAEEEEEEDVPPPNRHIALKHKNVTTKTSRTPTLNNFKKLIPLTSSQSSKNSSSGPPTCEFSIEEEDEWIPLSALPASPPPPLRASAQLQKLMHRRHEGSVGAANMNHGQSSTSSSSCSSAPLSSDSDSSKAPIYLDVGGTVYKSSLATLTKYPDSRLAKMISESDSSDRIVFDETEGSYFLDRDGALFRFVLNFCRNSRLALPQNFQELDLLYEEALYFDIKPMIEAVERRMKQSGLDLPRVIANSNSNSD